jgi:glucan phosphoethanolaminetransferase (alkaline phosphatase superfamily)
MRNLSIVLGIFLSIIFFFISFFTYQYVFMWTLPIVKNVHYLDTPMNGHFLKVLVFSVVIGLIPLTLVLIWKLANILSLKKRMVTALLIISFTFLGALTRYQMIRSEAKKISEVWNEENKITPQTLEPFIPLSKVNIEIYMLAGLLTGSVVTYFIFYRKQNKLPEFTF